MKKPKRSMGFDEKPDPSGEVHIDLDSQYDDEDIIDLEDIIEMPAGSIDEDEDMDLDVEILDAEPGLDFDFEKPAKPDRRPAFGKDAKPAPEPASEAILDDVDDLLKDFDLEEEDDDDLFGDLKKEAEKPPAAPEKPVISKPPAEEPAVEEPGLDAPTLSEEEDELLRSLLDEIDEIPEAEAPAEPKQDLKERTAAALKIEDETDRVPQPEPAPPVEPVVPEPPKAAVDEPPKPVEPEVPKAPEVLKPPEPAPEIPKAPEIPAVVIAQSATAALEPSEAVAPKFPLREEPAIVVATGNDALIAELVEELVNRIEFRLFETIRQTVEAKLPGVVREVISEEIERVKKEIEQEKE